MHATSHHQPKTRAMLISLVFVLILAACAPAAAENNPASAQSAGSNSQVAASSATSAPAGDPAAEPSFSKDILPIMQTSCLSCHGGEKTAKGFSVKTYAALMAGSQEGSVVTPGDPNNSILVRIIASGKMPKKRPHLPADQFQVISDWVKAGAKNN